MRKTVTQIFCLSLITMLPSGYAAAQQNSADSMNMSQPGNMGPQHMMGKQQPGMMGPQHMMGQREMMMGQMQNRMSERIEEMKKMDADLQSKVDVMKKARGDSKIDAMADVIDTLVKQRKTLSEQQIKTMEEMINRHKQMRSGSPAEASTPQSTN
jgi:hypothetical protein